MIKECVNCKQAKAHHAKGYCLTCYKKLCYQPKVRVCKRCRRKQPIHAKALCAGCYNLVFHTESMKAYSKRRTQNLDVHTFRELTKSCAICGFEPIVDVHYLDKNKQNTDKTNIVGLCPNHHRMANNYRFRHEIWNELHKRGFILPFDEKLEFHAKKQGTSLV